MNHTLRSTPDAKHQCMQKEYRESIEKPQRGLVGRMKYIPGPSQKELEDYLSETNQQNHQIVRMKNKPRNRKARYTFPIDAENDFRPIDIDDYIGSYNEKHVIVTKNADGIKKETVVKNYRKIHPVIQEESSENSYNSSPSVKMKIKIKKVVGFTTKIVIKFIYYIGLLSCIVI